ncbi:hypothetical protein GHK62_08710 [Sinorhizobium terangae]|uniref:Uncharacterized protein n=1 Tax=Sinorhizobium terangae TaxID=110322 RepID=A0A6N7LDQ1_SINTE|nr:hypothetical protein [Sinorhizobium terangae]
MEAILPEQVFIGIRGDCPLHDSLNRNRFKDKIMQQFKVLQRLCASDGTRGAVVSYLTVRPRRSPLILVERPYAQATARQPSKCSTPLEPTESVPFRHERL